MATIYYDKDADLSLITSKKVAIIGYGSQGHAHAQNLSESGVDVCAAEREGCAAWNRAVADGVKVLPTAEAAAWADVIMVLVPDTAAPAVYEKFIEPHLTEGKTLMFAHGFNIRYQTIIPPANVDVSMVAPKAPGHRVRETYTEGGGVPCLVAVHQDYSGQAEAQALAYACALGAGRAGVLKTTFVEETETDLFGEQAVLCGGVSELVKAGFETLVEAGYQPEIAYFECMHELKLIVDLMYRGGLNYMRYSVSDTAEHGDYSSGRRVITEETRKEMREILTDIQEGIYAKNWIEENEKGRPWFNEMRTKEQDQLLEQVGAKLREMMPFLDPVTIKPGEG
ncbi:MAG: ketol-acid reductoisomerase [Anaerolineae bacterium]|nr:ketol-acid reductoisomerase [Anaerolineae bacterium]